MTFEKSSDDLQPGVYVINFGEIGQSVKDCHQYIGGTNGGFAKGGRYLLVVGVNFCWGTAGVPKKEF